MNSTARMMLSLLLLAVMAGACVPAPTAGRSATADVIMAAVRATATAAAGSSSQIERTADAAETAAADGEKTAAVTAAPQESEIPSAVTQAATAAVPNPAEPAAVATARAAAAIATFQADGGASNPAAVATLQAAIAAATAQAGGGTATPNPTDAAAPAAIQAELPLYDVNPNEGRLGWVQPPVELKVNGLNQYAYSNPSLPITAADFVMSADITWNTQYGGSGCGFVLRSNGKKFAWNQYLLIMTRGASGHVLFVTMADGKVVNGRDIYAYAIDKDFQWENNTTNRLTVVGRGNLFSIYTNQVKLGEVDPTGPLPSPVLPKEPLKPNDPSDQAAIAKYQADQQQYEKIRAEIMGEYAARRKAAEKANKSFDRGFMAMTVLSQSGQATCKFENAWLWLLN